MEDENDTRKMTGEKEKPKKKKGSRMGESRDGERAMRYPTRSS
jgi:hypothetical protein